MNNRDKVLEEKRTEHHKNKIAKLVVDLYWEEDRMSSCGKETLDKLATLVGVNDVWYEGTELKGNINNECT